MTKTWTKEEILEIYNRPLIELLYEAATVHRQHHDPREVQVSTLLSIKTGGCPEDCGYCPQAARYHTDIATNDLMSLDQVKEAAKDGSLKEIFGAGTAAVISPVSAFEHADDVFEIPQLENSYASLFKKTLTSIQHNLSEDKHGWRHEVK